MKISFSTVPNSAGQGRIFCDGREYWLPVELVGELQEMTDALKEFEQAAPITPAQTT